MKRLLLLALCCAFLTQSAWCGEFKATGNGVTIQYATLLNAVTITGAGSPHGNMSPQNGLSSFQAYGTTTAGSGAVSVDVEAGNDGVRWEKLGTISLTLGTSEVSGGFTVINGWPLVRGNVTSISGTGAKVSLTKPAI